MKHPKISFHHIRRLIQRKNQRGIALLYTLSILAVALMTAMMFSMSAITDRKLAANYTDSTAARILADGAVSRAMASLMSTDDFNFVCSYWKHGSGAGITGSTTTNVAPGAYDTLWHIEKDDLYTFSNGPLRYNTTYYSDTDIRCPTWEYVSYSDNEKSTTKNKLYGRYAYVAFSNSNRLNINALGNLANISKITYGNVKDADILKKRLGRSTAEPILNFTYDNANLTASVKSDMALVTNAKIQDKFSDPGWTDADYFFKDVIGRAPVSGDANDGELKMLMERSFDFITQANGHYNKYSRSGAVITQPDAVPANGESYRFPLQRNDWNSIGINTIRNAVPWLSANDAHVNQILANLINYNATEAREPVTDVQNWETGNPTYTGNKRTPYINEMSASVVSSGIAGDEVSIPILVGEGTNAHTEWDVHFEKCSYKNLFNFQVELVNMYPSSGSFAALQTAAPIITGDITFEYYNHPDFATGAWSETKKIHFDSRELTPSVQPSEQYPVYTFSLEDTVGGISTHTSHFTDMPKGHWSSFASDLKIRKVYLKIDRIVLKTPSGQNVDLALMPEDICGISNELGVPMIEGEHDIAVEGPMEREFNTQTNDPRSNLARSEWSASRKQPIGSNTLGKVNTTVSGIKGSSNDPEDVDDPAYYNESKHISTAFIRHNNMQSLWELGAIHRGENWRTLNLKCAKHGDTSGMMGNYEDGDGTLLDQVTIFDVNQERRTDSGFINLNTSTGYEAAVAPVTFKVLFNDFPKTTTGNYAALDSYTGGTASGIEILSRGTMDSDDKKADLYANDLMNGVGFAREEYEKNKDYPLRRTSVMPGPNGAHSGDMSNLFPTTGNDAQREEVFSRIVNLLEWNYQKSASATILVIAQTLRDFGGVASQTYIPTTQSETGIAVADYKKILLGLKTFNGKNMTTKTFEPATSSTFNKYDIGLDQILGESRIIVQLTWDNKANNNKGAWKITRKQYVQ